jgi:geranylgeranyl reductase family protein
MIRCDALVAGGGPAGSTCARELRRAGWDVLVLDRARFPRDKVCAGWLTPRVFSLLDLDPAHYRAAGLTLQEITGFRTGLVGRKLIHTRYPRVISYAIRRCEFDHFLLQRADARVCEGTPVRSLRRQRSTWIVNDEIETPVVVGAGGHFCPVARHLQGRTGAPPVVAKEAEFRLTAAEAARVPDAPELFFCADLEGYGWCVRKGEYLNVGLGRRESRDFTEHLKRFLSFLDARYGLSTSNGRAWKGHAYLASGSGARPSIAPGVLLIGDAAGLAFPESGEGISPAIESGRLAAEVLKAANGRYELEDLRAFAEAIRRLYPAARRSPAPARAAMAAVGRLLLRSRAFTRHVVLDRWFLRT